MGDGAAAEPLETRAAREIAELAARPGRPAAPPYAVLELLRGAPRALADLAGPEAATDVEILARIAREVGPGVSFLAGRTLGWLPGRLAAWTELRTRRFDVLASDVVSGPAFLALVRGWKVRRRVVRSRYMSDAPLPGWDADPPESPAWRRFWVELVALEAQFQSDWVAALGAGRVLLWQDRGGVMALIAPEEWAAGRELRFRREAPEWALFTRDLPPVWFQAKAGPRDRVARHNEAAARDVFEKLIDDFGAANRPPGGKKAMLARMAAESGCSLSAAERVWDESAPAVWRQVGRPPAPR